MSALPLKADIDRLRFCLVPLADTLRQNLFNKTNLVET
jgi:hypothetical protein